MISGGYSLGQGVRYALKFAHQLVSVHGQGLKDWCSKTAAGFEHADAVRSGMSHHLIGPTDMSVRRCVGSHMHAALALPLLLQAQAPPREISSYWSPDPSQITILHHCACSVILWNVDRALSDTVIRFGERLGIAAVLDKNRTLDSDHMVLQPTADVHE
jgi:hypothetical protein